ncbi:MAG: acyltransferase family protein, partial [Lachnospiraceae bacterium]|nr:acyltransferase family protein [Lachnospiraceae bacterium]
KQASKQAREEWVDCVRGFAIACVIIGHYLYGRFVIVVFSFHIPLFFVISGYLFKPDSNYKTYCLKTIKKLALPTFLPMLIILILSINRIRYIYIEYLLGLVHSTSYYEVKQGIGPLWFYYAFVISCNIFNFIIIRFQNINYIIVFSCVISLMGYLISKIIILPWQIDNAFVLVIYLMIGYISKRIKWNNNYYNPVFLVSITLLSFIGFQLIGGQSYASRNYPSFPICVCFSIIICIFIMYLFKYHRVVNNKFFMTLGKNTTVLLGIHTVEYFTVMNKWCNYSITNIRLLDSFIHAFFSLTIDYIVLLFINWLKYMLRRIALRYIPSEKET